MADDRRWYENDLFRRIARDTPYDDWALSLWDELNKPRENLPWYDAPEMDPVAPDPLAYDLLDPALQQQALIMQGQAAGGLPFLMPSQQGAEMGADIYVPGYAQATDQAQRNYLNTIADASMVVPPIGLALRAAGRGASYLGDWLRGADELAQVPAGELSAPQRQLQAPDAPVVASQPEPPLLPDLEGPGPARQADEAVPPVDDDIDWVDLRDDAQFTGDYNWSNTTMPPSSASFIGGTRGMGNVDPQTATRMQLTEDLGTNRNDLYDQQALRDAEELTTDPVMARGQLSYRSIANTDMPSGMYTTAVDPKVRAVFDTPMRWNADWVSKSNHDGGGANKGWDVRLEDLLDAPELYRRYPELKNTRISLQGTRGGKWVDEGTGGSYRNMNRILVGLGEKAYTGIKEATTKYKGQRTQGRGDAQRDLFDNEKMGTLLTPKQTEVLLHELTHQIQRLEGRTSGGSNAVLAQNMMSYSPSPEAKDRLLNVNRADVGAVRLLDDPEAREIIEPYRALDAQMRTVDRQIRDLEQRQPGGVDAQDDMFADPNADAELKRLNDLADKLIEEKAALRREYARASASNNKINEAVNNYLLLKQANEGQNHTRYTDRILADRERRQPSLFPETVNAGLAYNERELQAIRTLAANDPANPQYVYNSIYGEAEARAGQNMANVPASSVPRPEDVFDVPVRRTLHNDEGNHAPVYEGSEYDDPLRTANHPRGVTPEAVGESMDLSTERPRTLAEHVDQQMQAKGQYDGDQYFSDTALDRARRQNSKSREKLIHMSPEEFLAMAKPGVDDTKTATVAGVIADGGKFDDVPMMYVDNNGNGVASVGGHEGRHRARKLQELGVKQMPVRLVSREGGGAQAIRWGSQDEGTYDFVDDYPATLKSEDGLSEMPFPVRQDQADIDMMGDVVDLTSKRAERDAKAAETAAEKERILRDIQMQVIRELSDEQVKAEIKAKGITPKYQIGDQFMNMVQNRHSGEWSNTRFTLTGYDYVGGDGEIRYRYKAENDKGETYEHNITDTGLDTMERMTGPRDDIDMMAGRGLYEDFADDLLTKPRKKDATVVRPERVMFPAIYSDERAIVGAAERQWQPETPLLKGVFGVDRDELRELHRENTKPTFIDDMRPPTKPPKSGSPPVGKAVDLTNRVSNPKNRQRLIDIAEVALDSNIRDMLPWYEMDPLRRMFHEELGWVEGDRAFDRFNQLGAFMSPQTSPMDEISKSTHGYMLDRQGRLQDWDKRIAPLGSTHMYHDNYMAGSAMERFRQGETFHDPDPMKVAQKTMRYYKARMGQNSMHQVGDAHNARLIGYPDVRPNKVSGLEVNQTPTEAVTGDKFYQKMAADLGITPVELQALHWGAGAKATGVTAPIGAGMLEMITIRAAEKVMRDGKKPTIANVDDQVRKFIRGEDDLNPGLLSRPEGYTGDFVPYTPYTPDLYDLSK